MGRAGAITVWASQWPLRYPASGQPAVKFAWDYDHNRADYLWPATARRLGELLIEAAEEAAKGEMP